MYAKLIAGLMILAAVLAVWYHIHSLEEDNAKLLQDKGTLTANYTSLQSASAQCSRSVEDFAAQSDTRTKQAQVAVEEAKKEAVENYKTSNAYLFAKPKAPIITKDNAKNYGGTNKDSQLNDYLATQELFNTYIDRPKK
jgi:hypothetical protein